MASTQTTNRHQKSTAVMSLLAVCVLLHCGREDSSGGDGAGGAAGSAGGAAGSVTRLDGAAGVPDDATGAAGGSFPSGGATVDRVGQSGGVTGAFGGMGGELSPTGGRGGSHAVGGADSPTGGVGPVCEERLPPSAEPPMLLSQSGLYSNLQAYVVAADMHEFSPQYHLWSDGADKTRWLYLPSCGPVIDTSDWDHWSFPVGTRAFKQFVVDEMRIETRLIHRYGPGPDDFLFAHYLWNEEESEAFLIDESTREDALQNPRGTNYTVPSPDTCPHCHGNQGAPEGGLPSRFLGPSAVQLRHDGPGLTLLDLQARGQLSHVRSNFGVTPGNARQSAALGYLHANCGFCHNETADGVHFPFEPMVLLLRAGDDRLSATGVYQSTVGVEPLGFSGSCRDRVARGEPELSCLLERMKSRVPSKQMPPLDTFKVDEAGVAIIEAWIEHL